MVLLLFICERLYVHTHLLDESEHAKTSYQIAEKHEMVCEKLRKLDLTATEGDDYKCKSERITKWLNENTLDKEEICLPYFYLENLDRSLSTAPLQSPSSFVLQKTDSVKSSDSSIETDSILSDSSFNDDDDDEYSSDEDDNDSVFGSIVDDNQLGVPQNLLSNRDKLNSDLIISKTIQGLEVLKVKWNTLNNDLLLKVENKLLPVHRDLLASHSAYLNERLARDSDDLIIEVQGSIADVSVLLEIIYECGWSISENNVNGVLKACKHLQMKSSLLNECEQYKKFLQRTSSNSGPSSKWKRKKFLELFNL